MTTVTVHEVWEAGIDSLREKYLDKYRKPGEFTTQEYAARYNVSQSVAYKDLSKLGRAGAVSLRPKCVDEEGHPCNYWKQIETDRNKSGQDVVK